jgi:hypothetical protein
MPPLAWNPVDFLEVLDVVPVEGECGTSYVYRLTRNEVRVELAVYPFESDIALKIYFGQQSTPVINLQLLDCPAARVVRDKQGDCIEFAAANAFSGRHDETTAARYGFRFRVRPFVQVEPYTYPV